MAQKEDATSASPLTKGGPREGSGGKPIEGAQDSGSTGDPDKSDVQSVVGGGGGNPTYSYYTENEYVWGLDYIDGKFQPVGANGSGPPSVKPARMPAAGTRPARSE